jgi:protein transport protein SEC24
VEVVGKFAGELTDLLQAHIALEAVVRIRASEGLELAPFYGNFFSRSTDLLGVPNINPHHSFSAQVSITENIKSSLACFQTAVLHTSCSGERRIRILNCAYPTTEDPREVLNFADPLPLADLLSKMAVEKAVSSRLEEAREALFNKLLEILTSIKNVFQTGQNPQLLLPDALQVLPLLLMGLSRTPAIRSGSVTVPDQRVYHQGIARTLPVQDSIYSIYPYMFALHSMPAEVKLFIAVLICSAACRMRQKIF